MDQRAVVPALIGVVATLGLACGKGDSPSDSIGTSTAAISDRPIATWDEDILSRSVVRFTTSLGASGTSFCTGTLISPRVVISAAHCFQGHNNFGGDPECRVRNPDGTLSGQLATAMEAPGCGYASFQRIFKAATLDQIPIAQIWINAPDPENDHSQSSADVAIVILSRRATPNTDALSPFVRPWLEPDQPDSFWANAPIEYFGWGTVDHIDSNCDTTTNPAERTDWLRFVDFKRLDSDHPTTFETIALSANVT